MSQITEKLRSNERILWQGKPVLAPFIMPQSIVAIAFGLVFMATSLVFFLMPALSWGAPLEVVLFLLLFFFAGFAIAFGPPIASLLAYRNTEYVITNQRLITQTGAIGLDTRFVDFDKIQEVYVKIGVFDKLFGTGSLYAMTASSSNFGPAMNYGYGFGGMYGFRPSLAALREPYQVQKLLQDAVERSET